MNMRLLFLVMALLVLALTACSGTQTFSPAARAGDTVTLAVGWQKNLLRENLTVTITDANGAMTTYLPNDTHVRAIVNLYPDPASRAVVDTATDQQTNGATIGNLINSYVTGQDNDWWQTSIVLDLPASMATGLATIGLTDSLGAVLRSLSVTILPGTGTSNLFNIYNIVGNHYDLLGPYSFPYALAQFEREPGKTVTFSSDSDINPCSIQMQLSHAVGIGKTWVVNPRGDIKSIMWSDDGSVITVMLMPAQGDSLSRMSDFKFYVSGGITNLELIANSLKAYDIDGNPVAGITAAIQ